MTNHWLFQATSERFDFNGFVASEPTRCDWLASRYANEMQIGDNVFLWRGKDDQPAFAGLVGLAAIEGQAEIKADNTASSGFWIRGYDSNVKVPRVPIRILALNSIPIDYDDLRGDPMLCSMDVFVRRRGSNFKLSNAQATALCRYWMRYAT